ncbi:MAG: hypothetical protein Q8Q23_00565 [bacterium]|nr:hypothetical protein [bacterium]
MKLSTFFQGVYYGRYEKYVHFFVSFLLFFFFLLFVDWSRAMLLALGAGIIKEAYDKGVRRTKFDVSDLAANVTGIVFALVVYYFVRNF